MSEFKDHFGNFERLTENLNAERLNQLLDNIFMSFIKRVDILN
jgi:hypothetical protein